MTKQTTLNAQIDAYYNTLDELAKLYATHEGAVSVAFQSLLADTARRHHWTLIPQLSDKGIRPDGTLKDPMGLVRGHWEAKDTDDNLDVEICKKIQKGYHQRMVGQAALLEHGLRAVLPGLQREAGRHDGHRLHAAADRRFHVSSVAEVLEKEFGKSLGDKDVNILDPCTGTGNFIVNLIRRIPRRI